MHETPPAEHESAAPAVTAAARWIVIIVGLYFLLRELAPILKPLFLAVLLAYVILPIHLAVKKRVPGRLSLVASGILSGLVLLLLTLGIQASVRTLAAEMPAFNAEAIHLKRQFRDYCQERFPRSSAAVSEVVAGDGEGSVREWTTWLVNLAAGTLTTAAIVGLYLLFLLLEAGRFPERVNKAFTGPRSETIMATIAGINRAIADFLTAKVKASLLLAVAVFIVLFVFGTRFAIIWAMLVLFCNFIPYLGSIIGYCVPTLFVLIQFGYGWEFLAMAIAMLAIHVLSATIVEPAIIGKAVGLSPLIVLFSLAFWGSIWGVTGMLLAVPLTVMFKIVAQHIKATRPVAKLLGED